ncbi:MAG: DNA cytosine methyltransferase [Bacilli bacterium]|jgi:DNA (cytosine-5)-methyltransferase 1|nr:DNA cytosine methyltransferase [Bacilli bacterium]
MYSVVDLFAGAGGLSLGFMQTGKYTVKAAVENNPHAQETYRKNHGDIDLYSDVRDVDYREILQKNKSIDVVIGGPPCQGFSNANRQHNQLINMNNLLVKEYVRAICELRPKAFVMENVSMLKSDVHRFYYTDEDDISRIIDKYSIPVEMKEVDLLPEKLFSPYLLEICQNQKSLNECMLERKTYNILNILHRYSKNPEKLKRSFNKYSKELVNVCAELTSKKNIDGSIILTQRYIQLASEIEKFERHAVSASLIPELNVLIPILRMFYMVDELSVKKIHFKIISDKGIKARVKSYSVCDYIKGVLSSPEYNYKIKSGILNAAEFGAPQKRQRFVIIGIKDADNLDFTLPAGTLTPENYKTVKDAIGDLEDVPVAYDATSSPKPAVSMKGRKGALQSLLCDSPLIYNHVATKSRDVALARFSALKEGQNFHDLAREMKENTYTDTTKTQNTIYQRLKYDEPSGTVLNVRKSMWIHPTIDRAISIREAARLQTFPDSYIFCGTKDAQYQQIGNAVPPILGQAIAKKIVEILDNL